MEPSDKLEDVEASLPFNEDIQVLEAPAQEEVNKVSYFPFQIFNDSLSYDVKSEEVLDFLNPSCYDENDGFVDNINEFIHVGKRKWDVIGYNGDPIYDSEGHFQINKKFSIWQQEHDMIVQTPKDDLILCSPNNFRSYLEDFDDCSSEHLDLFYEENYQPSLCSDLDKNEEVTSLKQDTCDKIFHLPLITLPRYVTEGMVWKHVPYPKSPIRQNLILDFRGNLSTSRRSLLSQFSSLPFRNGQSSFQFLLIPSQASSCEDVQGSQHSNSSSQSFEPLTFHDPFLRWIEHSPEGMSWHHFFPPTRLHELDLTVSIDMIHFLTHVIIVLNLSLFWSMMKHKGRYCGTLLDWLH
jgi:hypothetical protein